MSEKIKRTKNQKIYYYTQNYIYQQKINNLITCEERVVWLLSKYPHLRDCDKCLVIYYWKHVDNLDIVNRDNIHALTSSETIRRVRQHIQNELGLFLPTETKVILARSIGESAVREWNIMSKKKEERDE